MTVEIKVDLEGWKDDLGELKADLKAFREEIEVDLDVKGKGDLAAAKAAANDLDGKKIKVDLDVDKDALKDLDGLELDELDLGDVNLEGIEELENVKIGAELDDDFKKFLEDDGDLHRTVRYSSTGGHPPGARSATLRWDSKLDEVDFTHMLARAKLRAERSDLTTLEYSMDADDDSRAFLKDFDKGLEEDDGQRHISRSRSYTETTRHSASVDWDGYETAEEELEQWREKFAAKGLTNDMELDIRPRLDKSDLAEDIAQLYIELEAMEPTFDIEVRLKKDRDWDAQFFGVLDDLGVVSDWKENESDVEVDFRGTSTEIADAIESTGDTGNVATDGDGRPMVRDRADSEFRGWEREDMKWSGGSGMGFVNEGEQGKRLEREMDALDITANMDQDSIRREDIRRPDGQFFTADERKEKFLQLTKNMRRPEPGRYDMGTERQPGEFNFPMDRVGQFIEQEDLGDLTTEDLDLSGYDDTHSRREKIKLALRDMTGGPILPEVEDRDGFGDLTPGDLDLSGYDDDLSRREKIKLELEDITGRDIDREVVTRVTESDPDTKFRDIRDRDSDAQFAELSELVDRVAESDSDTKFRQLDRSGGFANTIDPDKQWLNSRGGPRTRGLWNAVMPDDFEWPGTGFRDKDGGGFFSNLFDGGGISMPNMRGFKKSLLDTDAFEEAAESAGTLGSKMKMLIPSMHKWYALLALAIPLLITMAVHALGAASALVALAGAGAAVVGLGMLGFGDNLNESLAEAKKRLSRFKDEIYGVFKPTFQSFSPFSADLLNTLPSRMSGLAGDLKGLTVFMDAFNDGIDGTIDWIGEVTNAIVAFEGPIEQLAMRFGDLLGGQIIKFFEWLVIEAYENQDMFIQLASAVKNLLLALYSLSMLFSELIVVFKPLTGLIAWFADLLHNRMVVGVMASVVSMWAMFAVVVKLAAVMSTLLTLGWSGIFLKIAASVWATLKPLAALAVALAKIIGLKATLLGMTIGGIALVATGLTVGAAAYNAVKPKNAGADFGGGGLPAGGSGGTKYGSPGGGGGGPTVINFNGPVTRDSLPSIESKVDSALGKNNYQNPDR